MSAGMRLVEAGDREFAWLLGEAPGPGLALPPGGVADGDALRVLRAAAEGGARSWMIVVQGEVVGFCGTKSAPRAGSVEIGYGVAASRRRCGHAGGAVALLVNRLRALDLRRAAAETEAGNRPSERVLERCGFASAGLRAVPGGDVTLWWRPL